MYTLTTYLKADGKNILISTSEVRTIEEASNYLGVMFTDMYTYYLGLRDDMRYVLKPAVREGYIKVYDDKLNFIEWERDDG